MAYRTCDDCVYNDGYCLLGHNRIFSLYYDENQCDDGTGDIYLEDGDYDDEEDDD